MVKSSIGGCAWSAASLSNWIRKQLPAVIDDLAGAVMFVVGAVQD
jgi:hypothetical protein